MSKNKELLKFNESGQWELLEKGTDGSFTVPSQRQNVNTLPAGWSMNSKTGAFHHSTHGVISTFKNPEGQYEIRHGGKSIGQFGDIGEAGTKIRSYINELAPQETGMYNRPSADLPGSTKMGKVNKGDEHQDLQCTEEDKKNA